MARKNKEYGPSQGAEMLRGLVEAAKQIRDEEMVKMAVPQLIRSGDKVIVRQFNGKPLKGFVAAVVETASGRKVKVISGPLVVTVDEKQVQLEGQILKQ
jgi:hypothetical protein